jgi:hypothetical protein
MTLYRIYILWVLVWLIMISKLLYLWFSVCPIHMVYISLDSTRFNKTDSQTSTGIGANLKIKMSSGTFLKHRFLIFFLSWWLYMLVASTGRLEDRRKTPIVYAKLCNFFWPV